MPVEDVVAMDEPRKSATPQSFAAVSPTASRPTSDDVHARERERIGRLPEIGLAISGGGIRSATFALGLVQALTRLGLFQTLDYISTVSGGGYLGGWLYALHRRGQRDHALRLDGEEPRQVRFLRAYSNYLTPKLGLFSGDTWAAVGTVARNLAITFTLLSLSLLSVLYLPWALHHTYRTWMDIALAGGPDAARLLVVAIVLLVVAFATSASNMARPLADGTWETNAADWTPRWRVQAQVIVPILVAMAILAALVDLLPAPATQGFKGWPIVLAGSGYAFVWATGLAVAHLSKALTARRRPGGDATARATTATTDWRTALTAWVQLTAFALPAGIVGAWVVVWSTAPLAWTELVEFRMPLLVAGFLIAITAHIGLAGALLSEETREWWARVGGQVLLGTLMLSVLVCIAVYAPPLLDQFTHDFDKAGASKRVLALIWAAVTGSGIVAGRSSKTLDGNGPSWLERIGRIAPLVFVGGYLLILAALLVEIREPKGAPEAFAGLIILGTLAWVLSRRADLNEFSLHALYRNRLVRCYLGASNANRKAHPFHGFDPNDDVTLAWPGHPVGAACRPYPIFNAAINLVGGNNLAWQQRKAASFVFTPDVCGYEYRVDEQTDRGGVAAAGANSAPPPSPVLSAYSRSADHGSGVLTVGLAMATSGAAAAPNMGYHTSPTLAFLMTVFNVRLGWWLRNPRYEESWTRSHKRLSLTELVSELLGLTTDERDFVYLSDGGHFENLGLYELVRRKCPFIIVSDAGQDGGHTFDDLGNALEKCRADFGIDIEIDVAELRPTGVASRSHCAVGTIHYEQADRTRAPGTLLYLKSSLTGNEPSDVLRYASLHPEFPHQSTADQNFDESQFESYRALGYHVGREVFDAARARQGTPLPPAEMFRLLRQRWTPAAPAPADGVERFSRALNTIWSSVRSNDDLRFLDGQIFPEWASLMATGSQIDLLVPESSPRLNYWLPEREEQRRAGFYVCVEMLQLMEDVYVDLRLDEHYDHIDNRGWMNLFQHWTWSGMLSATWAVTAATYDPRFQRFCAERLDLRPGRVRVPATSEPRGGRRLPDRATWTAWDEKHRTAERYAWQEASIGLNFWEAELVAHFLDEMAEDGALTLHPIRVVVESPRREDGHPFEFTCGYLILRDAATDAVTLVHVRVQNHLRKMGVAATALRELARADSGGAGRPRLSVHVAAEDPATRSVSWDEALPRRDMAMQIARWIAAFGNQGR